MKSVNKNVIANIMEKIAHKSLEVAADSRCMYLYHQPKQPAGIKKFKK